MREYRRRFVQLNMLLLGLVLLLVMAAVSVYMYRDYCSELKNTMEQVLEPLGAFSAPAENTADAPESDLPALPSGTPGDQTPASGETDGAQDAPEPKTPRENSAGSRESRKDIMTVFYTAESGEYSILSQEDLMDEATLAPLLEEIASGSETFGTLQGYVFYRTGSGAPYKIALTPIGAITHSMLRLALVLALVWLAAMAGLFFVSVRLSRLAVRPMEEALRREKQFVADASHDLKTPLSIILANTGILRENPEATVESQRRWLDSTEAAAKNMQSLVGNMLALAEAERRDALPRPERLDASAAVTKAALQLESVAYEKNVALETDVARGVTVRGYAEDFQRIAQSLLENAIKYEPPGGQVTVSLKAERRRARFSVHNGNSRIPAEDLPHVFERFYRGDKSRQDTAGGHGLGLAITKELAERMGGKISVACPESGGTEFTVLLPL